MCPRIGEMIESKYLKKENVGGEAGILVTIASCYQVTLVKPGADPEMKWALTFEELDKPMILNTTKMYACEQACGSDHSDDWVGKKVVLYEDPTIKHMGKMVGGIAVRAPRTQSAPVVPSRKVAPPADDEGLPF